MDEYTSWIPALSRVRGIENYRFEQRTKHWAVVVQGKVCIVVFPTTGPDRRGLHLRPSTRPWVGRPQPTKTREISPRVGV